MAYDVKEEYRQRRVTVRERLLFLGAGNAVAGHLFGGAFFPIFKRSTDFRCYFCRG